MTTNDGKILGLEKIIDNGPNSIRWNIVILGDGYTAAEISKYKLDAKRIANYILNVAPINEYAGYFNVFRVDVSSTDSGADDPKSAGGTGATARTYFDATFGYAGVRRALVVDSQTAINVATSQVPEVHTTIVIVNSNIYGGTGGSVATLSLASGSEEIAVHEMGHSAFGLADEYPYWQGCGVDTDRNQYTGGEPYQPNVTIYTDKSKIKWGDLIQATTPLPTTKNPNCANCDSQPSPVPAGTVGAFEGAYYYHCKVYRPEFNCRMRALGPGFCAVCQRKIRNVLKPFVTHWIHFSPIAGHAMQADIDFSSLKYPAKFAVVGDFDGDGIAEIAVAPAAPDSAGNDFWVMKYNSKDKRWGHLSPIAGHAMQADIDLSSLKYPAKFAVVGDFDGDGIAEIAVAPDAPESAGNDFWVMKYNKPAKRWDHLSPIAGHAMQADIDLSSLKYPAKFAVVGDFDGDGIAEIAVAPAAPESAGNDLWVMKYNKAAKRWGHLSPIAGHAMQADIDLSSLKYPAKFAVVGDFDGDGIAEIAVAPDAPDSSGNDLWVMKYNKAAKRWDHLSPIAGHAMQADIDLSSLKYPAKFAVVGDFDGDRIAEIVVAPDAPDSSGNDFWVMKYNIKKGKGWYHLSPIAGHATQADIDLSRLKYPAKFAVVGDFDGDGIAEIAVAPAAPDSAGNDLWVMKYNARDNSWYHLSPIPGHAMQADIDLSSLKYPAKFAVVGDFDKGGRMKIAVAPDAADSAGNDFWVMAFSGKEKI